MPVISTTQIFANGDAVPSTSLNNIAGQSSFTSDAVDDVTMQLSTGKLAVKVIQTGNIANSAITTAKLADANVTTDKIADANVTTAKIANANVTTDKIADANVTTAKIADANITAAKLSGAQTGDAPIFGVRAWVNFDAQRNESGGSDTANTNRFIRGSGNITSVLKNNTGDFTITFATAMPNANYAVSIITNDTLSGTGVIPKIYSTALQNEPTTMTTTELRIATNAYNPRTVCVMIVG